MQWKVGDYVRVPPEAVPDQEKVYTGARIACVVATCGEALERNRPKGSYDAVYTDAILVRFLFGDNYAAAACYEGGSTWVRPGLIERAREDEVVAAVLGQ